MDHAILFGSSSLQEVPMNLTLVFLPSASLPVHFLCCTIFSGLGRYVFSDFLEKVGINQHKKCGGSINTKNDGDFFWRKILMFQNGVNGIFRDTISTFKLVTKSIHSVLLKLYLTKGINKCVIVNVLVFKSTLFLFPKCGEMRKFFGAKSIFFLASL